MMILNTSQSAEAASLPLGAIINQDVCPVISTYSQTRGSLIGASASTLGTGFIDNAASAATGLAVIGNDDNTVSVYLGWSTTGPVRIDACWGSGNYPVTDNGCAMKVTAKIPIKRSWEV